MTKQQVKNTATNNNAVVQQAAMHTVVQPASLRAQRIAAIQVALHKKRIAAKQANYATIAKQQEFEQALALLAQQYGIDATKMQLAPRANSATTKPSAASITVNGAQLTPCKAVHALAELNNGERKATLAACKLHNINPATAATQYTVWRKKQGEQVAA